MSCSCRPGWRCGPGGARIWPKIPPLVVVVPSSEAGETASGSCFARSGPRAADSVTTSHDMFRFLRPSCGPTHDRKPTPRHRTSRYGATPTCSRIASARTGPGRARWILRIRTSDLDKSGRRVAAGDNIALMALYDRHNRQAFGLAFRILGEATIAEEVVQDAFSRCGATRSFDTARGGVRTWLLTIVHNRSIDRIRAAKSGQQRSNLRWPIMRESPPIPGTGDRSPRRRQVREAVAGCRQISAMRSSWPTSRA